VSVRRLIELRRTNHDLSTLNLANQKLSVVLIEVKHTNETIKTLLQDAQGFIDFMKEQLVGERKMNYERPNVMGKSIRSDYALFDAKA
jgi:predicted negative regulator of RcsB-dependent stress response